MERKELQRLKHEAYEISTVLVGDMRTNHLEERGNDMIHERVKQENLNSSVIAFTV